MRMALVRAMATAALMGAAAPVMAAGPEYGTFLRLVDAPAGSYDQMVAAVPGALQRAGWELIASHDAGTGGCVHKAKTFVVNAPAFTAEVLKHGPRAAFALPLRLSVYEDDSGVHLAAVNPQSLARTIVAEDFEAPSAEVVNQLRAMTATGLPGKAVMAPYGQMRTQGLIDKTMGVVAGGPFAGKIEQGRSVKSGPGTTVADVAAKLMAAGATPTKRWGLRSVYRFDLPGQHAVLVGFTGGPMESKSYSIVGSGLDQSRAKFACPGLDHAAAYPIELLVVQEGSDVKVLLIDEMFRMKMYFEDAGKMKFAANMAMPGSIENELRDLIEDAF
ncbi:MAG TPA: DUF302 domain-containing protein [Gemmatimonadales bacterium]